MTGFLIHLPLINYSPFTIRYSGLFTPWHALPGENKGTRGPRAAGRQVRDEERKWAWEIHGSGLHSGAARNQNAYQCIRHKLPRESPDEPQQLNDDAAAVSCHDRQGQHGTGRSRVCSWFGTRQGWRRGRQRADHGGRHRDQRPRCLRPGCAAVVAGYEVRGHLRCPGRSAQGGQGHGRHQVRQPGLRHVSRPS